MITTLMTTRDQFQSQFRDVVELWLDSTDHNWCIVIDDVELALDYREQRAGPYRVLNDRGSVIGFNDSARDFRDIGSFVYEYVKKEAAE